jgi:hypothetical protein
MKVPSAGIMLGYFFVFCAFTCSDERGGPGYRGGSFRSFAPCDGGLNFAGFSRTGTFRAPLGFGTAFWEVLRMLCAIVELDTVLDLQIELL